MLSLKIVKCANCGKKIYRSQGRINENARLKLNSYCSKECQRLHRTKVRILSCENCGKHFLRCPKQDSIHNYCSRGCAIHVNNKKYHKKQPALKKCLNLFCNNLIRYGRKYCSRQCKVISMKKYSSTELVAAIKKKSNENGRTPTKRELPNICDACVRLFGSWSNAVKVAGLIPIRSCDERMYKRIRGQAKDGHFCDSISEIIIDNWLLANHIIHQKDVHYPVNTNHRADWSVEMGNGKLFIEYFGLANDSLRYDQTIREKKTLCELHGIRILGIYPSDLYPVNYLNEKLGFLKQSIGRNN